MNLVSGSRRPRADLTERREIHRGWVACYFTSLLTFSCVNQSTHRQEAWRGVRPATRSGGQEGARTGVEPAGQPPGREGIRAALSAGLRRGFHAPLTAVVLTKR